MAEKCTILTITEYQKNMFKHILFLLQALLYIDKIHYEAKIQTETDNISNTEAGNCKQKVMKLHPDTEAKAKVVKALRVAKEEELSRTFE